MRYTILFSSFLLVSFWAYSQPTYCMVEPTGENATIVLLSDINPTFNGEPLPLGSYILAVFDNNNQTGCGGAIQWDGNNTSMSVYGFEIGGQGFEEGEQYRFKVELPNGCVIDSVYAEYQSGDIFSETDTYTSDGISGFSKFEAFGMCIEVLAVQPDCNGNSGSAFVNFIVSGVPPFDILWSNGATEANVTDLAPGTYTVTVTDSNGAKQTESITLQTPTGLDIGANSISPVSCFDGEDGKAAVSINGGVMPYTILWDNGEVADTAINLSAGTHEVTVTDGEGCFLTSSITIESPELIALESSTTNANCFGDSTGQAIIRASGGIAPYTYFWNNGSTQDSLGNLSAGDYSITVEDQNGCLDSVMVTVGEPNDLLLFLQETGENLCFGDSSVTVSANIVGGTPPYNLLWSTGQISDSIDQLPANKYFVTVTDNQLCQKIDSLTILEPSALALTDTLIQNESDGGLNGRIEIEVSGGSPPYSYLWSNNSEEKDLLNVASGSYTATITDDNGCLLEIGPFLIDNTVGLEEIEQLVFLNGFFNGHYFQIQMEWQHFQTFSVQLFDSSGKIIFNNNYSGKRVYEKIDAIHWPAGVYFLQLIHPHLGQQSLKVYKSK